MRAVGELHRCLNGSRKSSVARGRRRLVSGVYLPLTFIGDNKFGYEAVNNGCFYYQIWGFRGRITAI